ncbi:RNase H domain-containing protein [Trichonephila clavipes]|nr:RNase H domain-containing protein [Trichonephila clavipes]
MRRPTMEDLTARIVAASAEIASTPDLFERIGQSCGITYEISTSNSSGICIKSQDHILRIQKRNPDGCLVFRSELIAIDEVLGSLPFLPNGKEIWILSDSRSAIQHLSNWQSVRDNVGVSILTKLKRLFTSHQIHLQWISSHIDLEGNEIEDTLAKAGACEVPESSAPLTFLEIFSRTKHQNKIALNTPPRAPLVSMFSSCRLSNSWFYKAGSNFSSLLSKWPYQINEIFRRTQEL